MKLFTNKILASLVVAFKTALVFASSSWTRPSLVSCTLAAFTNQVFPRCDNPTNILALGKTHTLGVTPSTSRLDRENVLVRSSIGDGSTEIKLSNISPILVSTLSGEKIELGNLLKTKESPRKPYVLACLSHFADFNAWEVAQQYIAAIDLGDFDSDCEIVLVGIGSAAAAAKFAADLGLNTNSIKLVADEQGDVTEALGCYKGWLTVDKQHAERWPATDISPYIKLLGMIFGVGSPGTLSRVLYGYTGDREGGIKSRKWVVDALLVGTERGRFPKITKDAFDGVPADSGLRAFELATLRAQTGIHIVLNWGTLGPKDENLITRMGGTFVFKDGVSVYSYFDQGILTYAPIDDVRAATLD